MLKVRLTPKSGKDEITGVEIFGESRLKQVEIAGDADALAALAATRISELENLSPS